ncbi:hypothetical protein [Methylorubrum extorquens]|uniref:hypothetical protein n=1 Tax=Methylorubrum extorquens TaxID=408 RepID=UPI0022388D6C|nr:hypothetical protein [Methylorubrum extorquens]UYW34481.1 hypothetical protein OKB92_10485 [Methylorubrum extorquens]
MADEAGSASDRDDYAGLPPHGQQLMASSPLGFGAMLREGIRALKPHGAAPIVVVLLAAIGVAGLAAGAPGIWVIATVLIAFSAFFLAMERSAEWRRQALETDYDAMEKNDAAAVRRKLEQRRLRNRKKNEPSLFDERDT